MATLDAGIVLADISPGRPCGEDVEYDPVFLELEQAARGKPDAQYGATLIAATPPDWKATEELAVRLMARSHDLRVAVYYTRALLNRKGFAGLSDGLALIEAMIETYWFHLYPRLDEEDDNDPTARISALSVLVDRAGLIADARHVPLVTSSTHGAVSVHDAECAMGDVSMPAGIEAPSMASLDSALATQPDQVVAVRNALLDARHRAARIETLITERVGVAQAIDLSALSMLLQQALRLVAEHAGERDDSANAEPEDVLAQTPAAPRGSVAIPHDAIASRADVKRSIDLICAYYEMNEPSSPVPMLLLRARRLVDKRFIEIMQDLAPEGLGQVRQAGGLDID